MASRVVVPHQHQPRGGGKQKNAPAEGRNRQVLQDIGNLAKIPAVVGKPNTQVSRPITRSFCAQLLANAQAAAEKNKKPVAQLVEGGVAVNGVAAEKNKKSVAEIVNGGVTVNGVPAGGVDGPETKVVEQKKVPVKPKTESLNVLRSDEEVKNKPLNEIKSREGPSRRKEVKTLTSILTARSKAACGLTNKPKEEQIVNIDAADADNELAAAEYVEDIYKFYKLTEDENRVHDYMPSQTDINEKMRSILIDWLIEVHNKFELTPETLYLTIDIVDRYLSMKRVPRRELQLVGISSMLIASKYEEIWAPEVNDFVCISANAYVREQVLVMEKAILGKLEWYLTVPTPYVFLIRFIKASIPTDKEMENMVFFLAELGLIHYSTVIKYKPSMIAASAVYAANCTLDRKPIWSETLKHHTGYSEDQLLDCAKLLVGFHAAAPESKLKAVYRKFSKAERSTVAILSPAKNLLA